MKAQAAKTGSYRKHYRKTILFQHTGVWSEGPKAGVSSRFRFCLFQRRRLLFLEQQHYWRSSTTCWSSCAGESAKYRHVVPGNRWRCLFQYEPGKHLAVPESFARGSVLSCKCRLQTPYNIYGGLQDNNNWIAPVHPGGVTAADWKGLGGGDGFWVQPDPVPEIVYAESQGGEAYRIDRRTGLSFGIKPKEIIRRWRPSLELNAPIDNRKIYSKRKGWKATE